MLQWLELITADNLLTYTVPLLLYYIIYLFQFIEYFKAAIN